MPRGKQNKGVAALPFGRSNHHVGHTDASTSKQDAARLEKALADRPKKPPHRHVYVGGKCKVCNCQEIDAT